MESEHKHITPYRLYAVVLVTLLFLTALTILAAFAPIGAWGVGLALLIASVKVFLVLYYFMHLKVENSIFKIFTAMVFVLMAITVIITFFDYLYR
jgi:cytochrome c oxidase subunit 4